MIAKSNFRTPTAFCRHSPGLPTQEATPGESEQNPNRNAVVSSAPGRRNPCRVEIHSGTSRGRRSCRAPTPGDGDGTRSGFPHPTGVLEIRKFLLATALTILPEAPEKVRFTFGLSMRTVYGECPGAFLMALGK